MNNNATAQRKLRPVGDSKPKLRQQEWKLGSCVDCCRADTRSAYALQRRSPQYSLRRLGLAPCAVPLAAGDRAPIAEQASIQVTSRTTLCSRATINPAEKVAVPKSASSNKAARWSSASCEIALRIVRPPPVLKMALQQLSAAPEGETQRGAHPMVPSHRLMVLNAYVKCAFLRF